MNTIPDYEISVYGHGDTIPREAEELFARQLADSRKALQPDRPRADVRVAVTLGAQLVH